MAPIVDPRAMICENGGLGTLVYAENCSEAAEGVARESEGRSQALIARRRTGGRAHALFRVRRPGVPACDQTVPRGSPARLNAVGELAQRIVICHLRVDAQTSQILTRCDARYVLDRRHTGGDLGSRSRVDRRAVVLALARDLPRRLRP
jgi:hypothetical protein